MAGIIAEIIKQQQGGQCGWSGVSSRSAAAAEWKSQILEHQESCHKTSSFSLRETGASEKALEGTRESISLDFKRITLAVVLRMEGRENRMQKEMSLEATYLAIWVTGDGGSNQSQTTKVVRRSQILDIF